MKRKIISIVLIFMLMLMITVDLYNQQAVAVAPAVVLIPAATYAIYCGLAAAGVIGNTNNDHAYIANDYIDKLSDYEKKQWNAIAKYGMAAGSMLVTGILGKSILDYAKDNYTTGNNIKSVEGTLENITIGTHYRSLINKNNNEIYEYFMTYRSGYYSLFWGCSSAMIELAYNTDQEKIQDALNSAFVCYDGTQFYYEYDYNGTHYKRIMSQTNDFIDSKGTTLGEEYTIIGDSLGIGTDLSTVGALSIALPALMSTVGNTLSQIEADQALTDWIEQEMNKVNKSNKPNWGGPGGAAAAIAALAATSYYWLDPVTNTITQTTTQDPPPGEDWIPLPAPGTQTIPVAPSLPDNYPTEDNPEIKTKLSDPIITTIDNGDGTHTETKTQEETKTERYYDPEIQKWIEKTTKTKTTTTTDIDDQTGDRTETGRTTETLPDGNTTETPPPKDATDIDWGPLKQGMGSLTNKFPFCLPWDIYNSFVQFQGVEWSGIINIDISNVSSKFPVGWDFDIDFSMFDELRQILKKIELMLFDLGLILATRKLMGGGV